MAPTSGALAHGTAYLALLGLLAVGFHRLEADHLRIDRLETDALSFIYTAGPLDAEFHAKQRGFQDEVTQLRAENREIKAQLQALVASLAMNATGTSAPGRRRVEEDLAGGEFVVQHFADVVPASGGLGTGGTGCANCGHRRAQSRSCVVSELAERFDAINTACCTEPGETCSGGAPATCSADCAAVLLPVYQECAGVMDASTLLLIAGAAQGCRGSLVEQLNLACAEEGVTDCVPWCDDSLRGDQLLLSLNGNDAKFTCELRNGLYSWVGPATDGGYIGTDFATFFSSVVSGAAGLYMITLAADAGMHSRVAIQLGQDVRIAGEPSALRPPSWGTSSFTVAERAQLSFTGVQLDAANAVEFTGASATISMSHLNVPTQELFTSLIESMKGWADTALLLSDVIVPGWSEPLTGTITSQGIGDVAWDVSRGRHPPVPPSSSGSFGVVSGPCTTSQGGRCVGRRYSELNPWPSAASISTGATCRPTGAVIERCEIAVLGAGALAPSPVFDTVSHSGNGQAGSGGSSYYYGVRHDAVGLGGASCAPPTCDGSGHECYVATYVATYYAQPSGCYSGTRGPPAGTMLGAGEVITWAAVVDNPCAYHEADGGNYFGDASNRASAHDGWELCFV